MNVEELQAEWEKDSILNPTELSSESLRIPQLHAKYLREHTNARLLLRKHEKDFREVYQIMHDYYSGVLTPEQLRAIGRNPYPKTVLRADVRDHAEADPKVEEIRLKIEYQKEKVLMLEKILDSVSKRGYQIKNAIDWQRFMAGS